MCDVLHFAKGHGTLNDFVLITDPDNRVAPTDAEVRFLCDRRAGIGGDGLLRAVRARHIAGWDGDPEAWFMDYRNADASLAEMCGNGLRVFLRYLREEGLVPADTTHLEVGTRAGLRSGELLPDGRVRVWMGRPAVAPEPVGVSVGHMSWPATAVDVGNPHAVALVGSAEALDALDLGTPPGRTPASAFPNGVNVEFVEEVGPRSVRMRVHERGVGETMSCGTGTVAVAAAVAAVHGETAGTWTVQVPGGVVEVELADGQAWLTGPAEIVARGEVALPARPEGAR